MKQITPTEKKVLELIAAGFSTVEAAESMRISAHTVLTHRRNLLLKFNVRNSAQLVMEAIQNNIITTMARAHEGEAPEPG